MKIRSLKPQVETSEALHAFQKGWREARYGRLRLISEFFIPFSSFKVTISNGKKQSVRLLALDLAGKGMDLLSFESENLDTVELESDAVAERGGNDARRDLEDRVRRQVMTKGFFRIMNLAIELEPLDEFCVPYHVGIFERGDRVRLEVLNAVTGRLEGARVRELVSDWFRRPASRAEA